MNLSSFQDTLLLQNRGFVTGSHIEGDVDFMWGGGPVFFENCELQALHAAITRRFEMHRELAGTST